MKGKDYLERRSRTTFDNPLAAARSGKGVAVLPKITTLKEESSNLVEFDSKKIQQGNQKAEQIWHRRSGAGFHLFVEYYLGQPLGVVANETSLSNGVQAALSTTANGAGLSRAALRRKKKKRKRSIHDDVHQETSKEVSTTMENPKALSTATIVPQHRYDDLLYRGKLLQVLNSKVKPKENTDFYQFLVALSKPLPLTFRFRHYDPNHQTTKTIAGLRQILKSPTLAKSNVRPVDFDEEHIYQAFSPLEGYPWAIDKASLKRLCPELKEFLNDHTRDGTIARQELGSMLPVWLLDKIGALDVPKLLRILDMCASPGSKTLQAAEQIVLRGNGRVRANDVNANRLESLQEAIQRSGFLHQEMVKFSNVDASKYPIPKSEQKKYPIILCDVPCSGDGTCRKDTHVIPNWTPGISNALHSLQVKILVRAMRCCALHGCVSYSTCSLNPIEDEAVVAAALTEVQSQDASLRFELVPVALSKGPILRPGIVHWRVAEYQYQRSPNESEDNKEETPPRLQWHDSYESAVQKGMEGALPSMWPAKDNTIPLDRCLRLFPQDQDTGGFFVAILKRIP